MFNAAVTLKCQLLFFILEDKIIKIQPGIYTRFGFWDVYIILWCTLGTLGTQWWKKSAFANTICKVNPRNIIYENQVAFILFFILQQKNEHLYASD